MRTQTVLALTALMLITFASFSSAQAPRPKDDDVTPILDRLLEAPKSKSDAYRLVGKVLEIDKASGSVKLATEEGERVVKPTPQFLAAIRVGDTISVPRAEDQPVSASPRTAPRTR